MGQLPELWVAQIKFRFPLRIREFAARNLIVEFTLTRSLSIGVCGALVIEITEAIEDHCNCRRSLRSGVLAYPEDFVSEMYRVGLRVLP